MRDSKLGDKSPILRFGVTSWWRFLDQIVYKKDPRQVTRWADGTVVVATSVRSARLRYTGPEWLAFEYGVRAGELDPDRLTSEYTSFPELSSPASTGPSDAGGVPETGQASTTTEVRHGHDPSSVLVSRDLPGNRGHIEAAAGAVAPGKEPVPVAAELDPPAGRDSSSIQSPESDAIATTGQPGPSFGATNDGELIWEYDKNDPVADELLRQAAAPLVPSDGAT
jgi:hypothetical protein